MACARCDFYTPKDSSQGPAARSQGQPAEDAGRSIPLTDDERAAVDDGQAALDRLLGRLADIPTPAGPAPRQVGVPETVTLLPVIDVRQGTSTAS